MPSENSTMHAAASGADANAPQARRLSDAEVVDGCLGGDRRCWEALVRRYGRLVYRIASQAGLAPDDAADVFQTVFFAAFRNLHLIDRPASLRFWLKTTAQREAWQAKRRLARYDRGTGPEGAGQAADAAPAADGELERAERVFLLERALELLDERCRRLLDHLFFEVRTASYEEIGRALRMPIGSIGPTRGRCLEKLRRALAAMDPEVGRYVSGASPAAPMT